jgi:D-glycero-D-manno-heptose 1,7-bisphosphate phosphatase
MIPSAPSALQTLDLIDPLGLLPTDMGLRATPLQPCLFIDKDGTLIEDLPYNVDPARLRFMPGAGAALRRLQQAALPLLIVTNQSGLARGYFNRAQFAQLQRVLLQRLREEFGVTVLELELCPHAPDEKGRPACLCRKPAPGMLIRAAQRHGLDLTRSWMVGDTLDDVEAGHRAGAAGLLFDSGGESTWRLSPLRQPDAIFRNWSDIADHLLQALSGHAGCRVAAAPSTSRQAQGDPSCRSSGTVPANACRPAG